MKETKETDDQTCGWGMLDGSWPSGKDANGKTGKMQMEPADHLRERATISVLVWYLACAAVRS